MFLLHALLCFKVAVLNDGSAGVAEGSRLIRSAEVCRLYHLIGPAPTIASNCLLSFLTGGEHLAQIFTFEGAIFVQTCHISSLVKLRYTT